MLRISEIKMIILFFILSIAFAKTASAEEAKTPPEGQNSSAPTEHVSDVLKKIKDSASTTATELLNALIPKATRYAKDMGYAAICNDEMARKNHDDMKQVLSFVHDQTRELVKIIKASLGENQVTDTVLAVQANEKEAIKNNLANIGKREKIRSSILLAILPVKKLITFLKQCESETLRFPSDILAKMDDLEVQLDKVNSHLASKDWIIPAERGTNLQELSENIKKNLNKLMKEAVALQIINFELNKSAVNYLTATTENDLEQLKQELENLN